jgi:hypothetical protein
MEVAVLPDWLSVGGFPWMNCSGPVILRKVHPTAVLMKQLRIFHSCQYGDCHGPEALFVTGDSLRVVDEHSVRRLFVQPGIPPFRRPLYHLKTETVRAWMITYHYDAQTGESLDPTGF